MKSIERRSQRDYTLAFKLSVINQVEKGDMTYKQVQTRYGIQGRSTVLVCLQAVQNYLQKNPQCGIKGFRIVLQKIE